MTRPHVSVVMPFAGDPSAAAAALEALRGLSLRPGDELILSDNSGTAPPAPQGVTLVRAAGERSPAHARNAGAERARAEWILFLDADCRAPAGLLDAYFEEPVGDDVGALAGEVLAAAGEVTAAARYGAERSFLSQRAHLAHPFRPRAAAANLLVRRAAFEAVGGFLEGVRAAEDTDFSWRLQDAGWRLELRTGAAVEHLYRASVAELRRQWRGYAAGRAWLSRRYAGFTPEPAVRRAGRRLLVRLRVPQGRGEGAGGGPPRPIPTGGRPATGGSLERGRHLALDGLLALEELVGLLLSNRPRSGATRPPAPQAVLLAERFPALDDPLVELARTLGHVRVEAAARPRKADRAAARELAIDYREDDGAAARGLALIRLAVRHPLRCARDLTARSRGAPTLRELAPAARRIDRAGGARLLALGGEQARSTAERLARLAGRSLDPAPERGRHGRREAPRIRRH